MLERFLELVRTTRISPERLERMRARLARDGSWRDCVRMALYRARRIDWIKKKIAKNLPPAKVESTEDYNAVSNILDTHRPFATRIYSMLGLLGEAGEFAEEIYKGDKDGMVREGGDLLYCIAEACVDNDVVFEDLLRSACEKMASRYPNGYR